MMGPRGLLRVGHEEPEWMDPGFWFGQRVAFGAMESDRLHWWEWVWGEDAELLPGAAFRISVQCILSGDSWLGRSEA